MPVQIGNFEVVTQPEHTAETQGNMQASATSKPSVSPAQVRQLLRRMSQRSNRLRAD